MAADSQALLHSRDLSTHRIFFYCQFCPIDLSEPEAQTLSVWKRIRVKQVTDSIVTSAFTAVGSKSSLTSLTLIIAKPLSVESHSRAAVHKRRETRQNETLGRHRALSRDAANVSGQTPNQGCSLAHPANAAEESAVTLLRVNYSPVLKQHF